MQQRVYTPHSNIRKPWLMIREMIVDIRRGNDLAKRLTIRDIKALYRQSFLGILWAFILPLANTLVWVFLNNSGIVAMGETDIPYPIYVFSGTMIWAIFMESMQAPIEKTTQNKSILAKVNFPREALVVAGIYQGLFNAGVKLIILVIALAIMGYFGGWSLLLFPLGIVSLVLGGTAIGLLLTPLGMLYTDISKAIPLVMQFLMYTTPVVYAVPKEGFSSQIVRHNPITPLIMTARDWLTGVEPEFLNGYLWMNLVIIIMLIIVFVAYRLAMPILIERMNA
ncbi:MAG: ABC transporter permease [Flavobacteriales bacterium]|nr:ABC transporter permease [Flavobacteriales bacterium]